MANLNRIGAGQQQPSALLGRQLFGEITLCSIEFFGSTYPSGCPAGVAQRHKTSEHRFEQIAFVLA